MAARTRTDAPVPRRPGWTASRPLRLLWEQVGLPGLLRRTGATVLHSPHYTFPVIRASRTVVTLHDATFFSDPAAHSRLKRTFFRTWTGSHGGGHEAPSRRARQRSPSSTGWPVAPAERRSSRTSGWTRPSSACRPPPRRRPSAPHTTSARTPPGSRSSGPSSREAGAGAPRRAPSTPQSGRRRPTAARRGRPRLGRGGAGRAQRRRRRARRTRALPRLPADRGTPRPARRRTRHRLPEHRRGLRAAGARGHGLRRRRPDDPAARDPRGRRRCRHVHGAGHRRHPRRPRGDARRARRRRAERVHRARVRSAEFTWAACAERHMGVYA